jgi:Domain of unknown function (DUF4282)
MFDFKDLFQWDRFITPTIIKTFYWLVIGVIVLFGISGILLSLSSMAISPFVGFIQLHHRRHRVLAHRRRVRPDRIPHQRTSRCDPRPGRNALTPRAAIFPRMKKR